MKNVAGFWRIGIVAIVLFLGVAGVIGYKVIASSPTAYRCSPSSTKGYKECLHKGTFHKERHEGDLNKQWHKGQLDKEGYTGDFDKKGHKEHSHLSHPACRGCCCNRL